MTDSEVNPPSIMNLSLKYGLFSAAGAILIFVIRAVTSTNPFGQSWPWTVVAIIFSVAILVLAHREFKTNGNGFMSYGQGFKIGFLASIISVVIYGIFLLIYTNFIDSNVMTAMLEDQRIQMENSNTPDEQIDVAIEWTEKLFWPIFFVVGTFFSVITVLIVTIFTQRRNPDPFN